MKSNVRRPLWKNNSISCHSQSNFQKAKPPSDYIKTSEKEADVFLVNSTFSPSLTRQSSTSPIHLQAKVGFLLPLSPTGFHALNLVVI